MGIVLGANRYGKAETRVVRIVRDTDAARGPRPQRLDVAVRATSPPRTSHGDQAHVLPTDTQKNTVFAFAKQVGIGEIEDFGLALGPALRRRRRRR